MNNITEVLNLLQDKQVMQPICSSCQDLQEQWTLKLNLSFWVPDKWGNCKSQSYYYSLTNQHHCTYSSRLPSLLWCLMRQLRTFKRQEPVICQKCIWWKVLVYMQTRQLNRQGSLKRVRVWAQAEGSIAAMSPEGEN